MSGVTGNNKIQSRADFREILKTAKTVISGFPGFVSIEPTGSYNSNKKKTTFGDIDLITHIDGSLYDNDKKKIKSALAEHFKIMDDNVIVPFVSEKYKGKKYYNSGEIITISLNTPKKKIEPCQIDYIISINKTEADFKKNFLDMPAEKQGLILGIFKTVLVENKPSKFLNRHDIACESFMLENNQEFEFSLSSVELQLRKITYIPNSYKEKKREIVWSSNNWKVVTEILLKANYNISSSFLELLTITKDNITYVRCANRIVGTFKSMITVKSGEVGKTKGFNKQKNIDLVESTFRQYDENPLKKFKEVKDLFKDFKFFLSCELKDDWSILLKFKTNSKLFSAIKKVQKDHKIAGMEYQSSSSLDGLSVVISIPRINKKFNIGDEVQIYNDGKLLDTKKWKVVRGQYPSPIGYNDLCIQEINNRKKYPREMTMSTFDLEIASKYIKGQEYKVYSCDDTMSKGIFIGTGKGRLSPNKGKDVYIFRATKDEDCYIDGKFKIGFWEVEENITIIEEVEKDIYYYIDLKDTIIDFEIAKYAYYTLELEMGGVTNILGYKMSSVTSEEWVGNMTPKEKKLAFDYIEKGNFKRLSHIDSLD